MKLKPVQGVAFAIGVALAGLSYAQTSSSDRTPSSTDRSTTAKSARSDKKTSDKLPRAERNFIEKAAQHNAAEVELGKVAEKNASSDEVKKFARQMVDDHTKANEELKTMAQAKGIDMPAEPDRSHRRAMDKMQKETGADFDRDYMKDMVKDHEADIKDYQKQARDAKDPEVKAYAEKAEAVIQKHLDMAKQLDDTMRSASNTPSTRNRSAATGSSARPSSEPRSSGTGNR